MEKVVRRRKRKEQEYTPIPHIPLVEHSLSLSDLLLIDGMIQATKNNDRGFLENILYDNGLDVSRGYSCVTLTHRNLQGNVVNCPRYQGYERYDDIWIKTGAPSFDVRIALCKTPEDREHFRKIVRKSGMSNMIDNIYVGEREV